MKVYIAGKVSGLPRDEIDRKFNESAKMLVKQGHEPFNPTVLPDYEDVPHDDYMHVCYAMIDICDAVYMQKDWQSSKGARLERQYAFDWDKQIVYEDPATKEDF